MMKLPEIEKYKNECQIFNNKISNIINDDEIKVKQQNYLIKFNYSDN